VCGWVLFLVPGRSVCIITTNKHLLRCLQLTIKLLQSYQHSPQCVITDNRKLHLLTEPDDYERSRCSIQKVRRKKWYYFQTKKDEKSTNHICTFMTWTTPILYSTSMMNEKNKICCLHRLLGVLSFIDVMRRSSINHRLNRDFFAREPVTLLKLLYD